MIITKNLEARKLTGSTFISFSFMVMIFSTGNSGQSFLSKSMTRLQEMSTRSMNFDLLAFILPEMREGMMDDSLVELWRALSGVMRFLWQLIGLDLYGYVVCNAGHHSNFFFCCLDFFQCWLGWENQMCRGGMRFWFWLLSSIHRFTPDFEKQYKQPNYNGQK